MKKLFKWLLENPVARRFVAGVAAILALWLVIALIASFPVFFGVLIGLAVAVGIVYFVGSLVWVFIEG